MLTVGTNSKGSSWIRTKASDEPCKYAPTVLPSKVWCILCMACLKPCSCSMVCDETTRRLRIESLTPMEEVQARRTSLFVAGLIAIGQLTGIEVGWCIALPPDELPGKKYLGRRTP